MPQPNSDSIPPPAFGKSGKTHAKTLKVGKTPKTSDSKSSKSSKSAKHAKHAKSYDSSADGQTTVNGKTRKEYVDGDYSLYGMGRVTGFDVERSNGAYSSGLVGSMMVSLVGCVLFSRQ